MRVLILAAAALTLSGCWIFEDSPQFTFRTLSVAQGDVPVEFETGPRRNGFFLVGPFIAPCPDARITADVNNSDGDIRLIVQARGCEVEDEPTPFDYEFIWAGDDGSYSLTVRHENEANLEDGVRYTETVVVR